RIAGGQNVVAAQTFVNRAGKYSVLGKLVPPAQNRRLLPQMTVGIAAYFLVFAQIGLLEVSAVAHQQKLEGVAPVLAVELGGAAESLAKIVQFFRLRRIQIPSRCKAIA